MFNSATPEIGAVEQKIQDILNTNVKKEEQWYNF
jgi:hypothetical protein